jgi:hypothetical protein
MTEDPPAVRCLQALERDLKQHLGFRPSAGDDPVAIYVLDDKNAFAHFLKFYFPELPPRRAFFLSQGRQRVVYTYSSPRLEEDLRHEATHALLRGTFGDLPLWLDEGLAEYFETDLSQPDPERTRMDRISNDISEGWTPNLERLESLSDIRQMTPRDYREAWAWVHLLLNGPAPIKTLLAAYLQQLNQPAAVDCLSRRLAPTGSPNDQLLAHLKELQARPVARKPIQENRAIRLQDRPIGPPATPAPPHGLWRRLRAWLGFSIETHNPERFLEQAANGR